MASSIDNAFITQYGRRKPKMPQKRTRPKVTKEKLRDEREKAKLKVTLTQRDFARRLKLSPRLAIKEKELLDKMFKEKPKTKPKKRR